ncbi:MAG: GNAT family N-acetyltransferase [Thermodesulfobacteriota bacterium]
MMKTVLLDKLKHDRKSFNCSIEALNNYLKLMASQQDKKDNNRTFILEDETNNSRIAGFYTLTMATIDIRGLPSNLQKKHNFSNTAGLIARLAVDKRYKGKGFGEWLLIDALKKLLSASDTVAFPIIIVDAKEGSKLFYEKYGFTQFHDSKNKLFITIADVRASLG